MVSLACLQMVAKLFSMFDACGVFVKLKVKCIEPSLGLRCMLAMHGLYIDTNTGISYVQLVGLQMAS